MGIPMLGTLDNKGHQARCDSRPRRPIEGGWTDRQPSSDVDEYDYEGRMGR